MFFFQAEDGIRDGHVTGVQTCALPISRRTLRPAALSVAARGLSRRALACADRGALADGGTGPRHRPRPLRPLLRRQLPGRLRADPRAGRPAHHPRGAGGDPPEPPAEPERRLRGRRVHRSGVDLLPDGEDLHPTARVAPEVAAASEPLLSGVFTADNMDYVLRDSYMCGVAVGPIDIDRII